MVTLTLKQIVDNVETLKELAVKPLPARAAFKIGRILKTITNEYNTFQDARQKLLNKYGERDGEGKLKTSTENQVIISAEYIGEFYKELNELLESQVEVNIDYIRLVEIGSEQFTPAQMAVLEPFIEQ